MTKTTGIFAVSIIAMMAVGINTGNANIASSGYVNSITGSLPTLTTAAKGSLVVAVNELDTKISGKADAANVYDKTTSDTRYATTAQVNAKQDKIGGGTSGTVITNTGTAGTVGSVALGTLAGKDTVATADITDANVTKAKLAADVQTSLGKADTALQAASITGKEDKANITSTVETDKASTTKYTSAKGVADYVTGKGYITNADISGKANTADVYDKAASDGRYATATQGVKADTALQAADIAGKADRATTLAGYGITDAATATQGAKADTALQKSGTLTAGNLVTTNAAGEIIDAGAKGALAGKDTVTSGDITDGTIVNADISPSAAIAASKISGLATVATTGSYNDLANKPSIPTDTNTAATLKTDNTAAQTTSASESLLSGTVNLHKVAKTGSYNDLNDKPIIPVDTDTHHVSNTVIGASATATANAVTTNTTTFLNHVENGAIRNSHKVTGAGSVSVAADASGALTITGTDTNTTNVTATPSGTGNMVTNVTASGAAVTVTKSNVQIPVGSATATTYATIWIE